MKCLSKSPLIDIRWRQAMERFNLSKSPITVEPIRATETNPKFPIVMTFTQTKPLQIPLCLKSKVSVCFAKWKKLVTSSFLCFYFWNKTGSNITTNQYFVSPEQFENCHRGFGFLASGDFDKTVAILETVKYFRGGIV